MKKSPSVALGSEAVMVILAGVVVVSIDLVVVVIVEEGGVTVPSGIRMLVPLPGRVLVKLLLVLEEAGGSV